MRRLMRFLAAALLGTAAWATGALAQQRIDAPGPVAHRAAETTFPERVGEFARSNVHQYDREGWDISAGYMLARPGGQIELTVYIYPSARIAAATGLPSSTVEERARICGFEFEDVQQAITGRFDGAVPIRAGAAPRVGTVDPDLTRHTRFRLEANWGGERQRLHSDAHLYCFVSDEWQVKYRVTGPAALDADDAVALFIRTGPWPGREPAEGDQITAVTGAARVGG